MKSARFDFETSLRELLARDLRGSAFSLRFNGRQTAKHLIESLGIPHTEIGLLYANGKRIRLETIVHDGDQLQVLSAPALRGETREPRFVLDGHLGRLASHLRMLGLDCLYRNDYQDAELVAISVERDRILLTRDRMLLMHKVITRGCLLRSLIPFEQLQQVVGHFELSKWVKPFQRCMRCNHSLEPVDKKTILERLEPLTEKYYHEFKLCPACNQIYWKGSHYERMQSLIKNVT